MTARTGEAMLDETDRDAAFEAAEARANALLPRIELRRKRAALDFGCGTGAQAIAFARRFEHVVGLDDTAERIGAARQNAHEQRVGNVIFMRTEELDRLAAGFDLVHAGGTFRRIPPIEGVGRLEQLARLVGEGGVLALDLVYRPVAAGFRGLAQTALPPLTWLTGLFVGSGAGERLAAPYIYRMGSVLRALEAAGLTHVEIELPAPGTAFLLARRPEAD